jgi:hypothetical protein
VGPKPFGYGDNTEYGPDSVRFVGTPNFGGADFREFPNRPKVILFQPLRHFGIVALPASQFDDCDNRVGVPVSVYRRYNIIDMEVVRTATTKIEEHQREIVKAQNSHRTATEATEIASDDKTKRLN